MAGQTVSIKRPERWDHPLDPTLNASRARWLLELPPFAQMDPDRFAAGVSLLDILCNDCRIWELAAGDVVFQEGQYGGSAYLVLEGRIRIFLSQLLTASELQRRRSHRQSRRGGRWLNLSWVGRAGTKDRRARRRVRQQPRGTTGRDGREQAVELGLRSAGRQTRVFLQDIPGVVASHQTAAVGPGELFGEMAAVARTPREFTAAAETDSLVLEIRWQGLKLLRQDPAFRRLLDERYRGEVLQTLLRETGLFRFVPDEHLRQLIAATQLEQFGDLEWYARYKRQLGQPPGERIKQEPLVAEEGQYAASLWIVRSGFGRLSHRQGAGHRTLAYLGKGQLFGLREVVHNARRPEGTPPLPYQQSLRAVGCLDLLRIPKQAVQRHLLPFVRAQDLPPPIESPRYAFGQPILDAPLSGADRSLDTGLLEFVVDRRLINGRQAMVIDLQRCTRCDDCVRACASTHGGTPVFVRQGPQYGRWLFPQACMHCEDPVCMIGCPTGAIHRDVDSGLVRINQACIGCGGCADSCPYDNIRMVVSKDQQGRPRVDQATGEPILHASKCDLCADGPGQASCQVACPHDALVRLDVSDLAQFSRWVLNKAG